MTSDERQMDVEVEHPHVHHHGTGHRWLDLALPIAALFVSFVSIYIAWHHGKVMQELVHQNERLVQANSLPFLQLYGSNVLDGGKPGVSLAVSNQGIGPAEIRSVQVAVDGRSVRSLNELLSLCCGTTPRGRISTSTLLGRMVRPGEEVRYINAFASEDAPIVATLEQARRSDRIVTSLCYCSVFDECWTRTSRDTDRPVRIEECPTPEPQFRE